MSTLQPYILMLEDDDDDRHITRTHFADNNFPYKVEFLANSEDVMCMLEGCAKAGTQLPAVILLDVNAPATGGITVLKDIKSHPVFRVIPVVMISGSVFRADVNECYRLGANSFIAKPFSADLTAQKIRNFLEYWFGSVELPDVTAMTPEAV